MQTMAANIGSFEAGRPDLAELHAYMGIAAVEQFCLDGNWDMSWRPTGLEAPPFSEWSRQDVERMRKDQAKTRLLDKALLSAVIAETQDDELLVKRLGKGGSSKTSE